jgi:hypothetical protein
MRYILFLSFLVVLGVWGYQFFSHKALASNNLLTSQTLAKIKEKNQTHLNLDNTNITPNKGRREHSTLSMQAPPLFQLLSLEEAKLDHPPRKHITPIAAISLTNLSFASLKPKESLLLPDIDGNDYKITIRTVKHSSTITSIYAQYNDEGISYATTITQGDKTGYISLSTPEGSYEIETENGIGYLYKTQEIRKHLHTSHKNDMILFPLPSK